MACEDKITFRLHQERLGSSSFGLSEVFLVVLEIFGRVVEFDLVAIGDRLLQTNRATVVPVQEDFSS